MPARQSPGRAGRAGQGPGDYAQALRAQQKALELWQRPEDWGEVAGALHSLGTIVRERGNFDQALAYFEESLARKREVGNRRGIAVSLVNLAILALRQEELEEARDYLEEGLRIFYALERRLSIGVALASFVELALHMGQFERATRLMGAVYGLTEAMGLAEPPVSPENVERYLAAGRQHLEPQAFERELAEGKEMNLEQILAYALQRSEVGAGAESALGS